MDEQGAVKLQDGRHQELALEHDMEDAKIEIAVYHDDFRNQLLSGVGPDEAAPAGTSVCPPCVKVMK